MTETILHRARLWTVMAAVGLAIVLGLTVSVRFATGFFLAALWATASFWVLERLLKVVIVPPGTPRNGWIVAAWLAVKFGLYGLAVWGLLQKSFPALSHILGLTLLLVTLVAAGITAGGWGASQQNRRGDDGETE